MTGCKIEKEIIDMGYCDLIIEFDEYFSVCEDCGMTPEEVKKELLTDPAGTGEVCAEEAEVIASAYEKFIL